MKLLIMTRGRVGNQITLGNIPARWRNDTYLVVPREEVTQHDYDNIIAVPPYIDNYSRKFQWCLEKPFPDEEKIVIMDDDLTFSWRRTDPLTGKTSFVKVREGEEEKVARAFDLIEELLDNTVLVSMHPRQMAHNAAFPWDMNKKVICMQGVNRTLADPIPNVSEHPILADVFFNMAMLSRGLGNKLITTMVQDHASCQAPGGCSIYRTPEMQQEAVEAVARMYPDYAQVVFKKAKQANWMGSEGRYDLRVQWKKLYEHGVRNRG